MEQGKEVIILYPKEFISCVWDKSQNRSLNRLLEEVKSETHSEHIDADLLQPEHPSQITFEDTSFSDGSRKGGYVICLHPRHAVNLEIAKFTIDHELFHIRKGHCDLSNRLPAPLAAIFYRLVAEPLAQLYGLFKYKYVL